MNDFTFQAPTKVVFGKGVENQVGQLCKEQGATKVLVHFGGQSARKAACWTGCTPLWTRRAFPMYPWAG